ncbi:MAG: 3-oxoacyl-[acyl-carrier-protein] synthase III C-terminal domain-containing protein [Chlamydiota bacterium]
MLLTDFHSIRPTFETSQAESLDWFVDAHTKAESMKGLNENELALFREALKEKLWHVGCKPDRIEKRGHVLADFLHRDWEKMEVYRLGESPSGKNLSVRAKIFETQVDRIFEQYYPDSSSPPDDLIHVSCTGYVSPSGAQKIVSRRGWGQKTTVTHAYHMGCYGAFPAIRMATGFLSSRKSQADVVHTEICCLHSNPSLHQSDQLVSQSLFADGFIKYSVLRSSENPHLKILATLEEIIPDSVHAMTWTVVDWGFRMSLAKEVPVLIARTLKGYLERLCEKAEYDFDEIRQKALFAIHPGGPKILLQIQELLKLSDAQMAYSFQILKTCGNMSSATLPHVWQMIYEDGAVLKNTPIVSLAFGPGLSISGSIMEKICGS